MLDETWLFEQVKKYAASPEGRKRIKEQTGIDYDPKKDKSISQTNMLSFAEKMRTILWRHINREIKSVSIDDIIIEPSSTNEKGEVTISLSFRPGSLFRPSLQPGKYPEGVQNILLHFTHGWSAKKSIRGEWHGDEVWSRKLRTGSSFMQEAVEEFNSQAKGMTIAELSGEYKK
jgi:hypothetical protein